MSLIHDALKKAQGKDIKKVKHSSLECRMTGGEQEGVEKVRRGATWRIVVLFVLFLCSLAYLLYVQLAGGDKERVSYVPRYADLSSKELTMLLGNGLNVEALKKKAVDLFGQGNFKAALAHLEEGRQRSPQDAEIMNSLGAVYRRLGDFEKSRQMLDKALALNPRCCECLNNIALLDMDEGKIVEAAAHLKKAIELDEGCWPAYFNFGVLMESEGNIRSAVKYYRKFLALGQGKEKLLDMVKARVESLSR